VALLTVFLLACVTALATGLGAQFANMFGDVDLELVLSGSEGEDEAQLPSAAHASGAAQHVRDPVVSTRPLRCADTTHTAPCAWCVLAQRLSRWSSPG
jgi:hypothetical protein